MPHPVILSRRSCVAMSKPPGPCRRSWYLSRARWLRRCEDQCVSCYIRTTAHIDFAAVALGARLDHLFARPALTKHGAKKGNWKGLIMEVKRPTLADIASAAGVSRATVSLVVRRSPLVAEDTRARVEQVMAELDYVRDIGAARLRNNSSRTVGVLVPNLVNPFFTEFLIGVEQVMGQQDRVVLLANSEDDPGRQWDTIQRFRGHGVDGVILCPAEGTDASVPARIRAWGLPVVQALREIGTNETDYAGADYVEGVGLAMRHLVELGHRRIAFLSVRARTSAREERLRGFSRALKETGLQSGGIVEAELSWEGASQAAVAILALEPRPTAVLCFNDVLAAGLMLGLRIVGVLPGEDMAVVGLDDLPLAELTFPALTSVAMNPRAIGAGAARLLTRRLESRAVATERFIQMPELVRRASSQPWQP